MNSGYYPNVVSHKASIQTLSNSLQTPFYFGGSQVPQELSIPKGTYSGSGIIKRIQHSKGLIVPKPYKLANVK